MFRKSRKKLLRQSVSKSSQKEKERRRKNVNRKSRKQEKLLKINQKLMISHCSKTLCRAIAGSLAENTQKVAYPISRMTHISAQLFHQPINLKSSSGKIATWQVRAGPDTLRF